MHFTRKIWGFTRDWCSLFQIPKFSPEYWLSRKFKNSIWTSLLAIYVLNYEKRVWFHGNLHRKTASLTVHPVTTIANLVKGLLSANFISRDFIGSNVMKEGTRLNNIIHITNFSRFVLFFWFHLKFHSIEHNSINFIIFLVQSRGIFHELTHLMAIPVVEFSSERYKIRKKIG